MSPVESPLLPAYQPQSELPDTLRVRFSRDGTSWPGSLPPCALYQDSDSGSVKDHQRSQGSSRPPRTVRLSAGDVINIAILEGKYPEGATVTVSVEGTGDTSMNGTLDGSVDDPVDGPVDRRRLVIA